MEARAACVFARNILKSLSSRASFSALASYADDDPEETCGTSATARVRRAESSSGHPPAVFVARTVLVEWPTWWPSGNGWNRQSGVNATKTLEHTPFRDALDESSTPSSDHCKDPTPRALQQFFSNDDSAARRSFERSSRTRAMTGSTFRGRQPAPVARPLDAR